MAKNLSNKPVLWWVFLLEGVLQLILGFFLIFSPDVTTLVLIQFLGLYWMIRGIIMAVRLLVTKEKNKGWILLGSIAGIIAGILVLRYPIFSSIIMLETLVIFIALVGMVQGMISFVEGLTFKQAGNVVLGIILWLICLSLFFNPLTAAMALPIVIGILWIIGGTALTVMSFSYK